MSKIRLARCATLFGYFGLLLLIVLWTTWLSPPRQLPVALVLLLLGGPLLIPLFGLLHGNPYTHAWTSILAMLYLAHGIIECYSNPEDRLWASLEILLSCLLFFGAAFYARYRTREPGSIQQAENSGR